MSEANTTTDRGDLLIVQPETAESHWQPVPANGHIEVHVAPGKVRMETKFGFGTQTVAPGCYVREHSHDRNEELIHCVSGSGTAVLDGEKHRMTPGTSIFLGRNRVHMFINDGAEDLKFLWLLLPNGLEDFFAAIGRPRTPGEKAPAPFPRPADVLAIERRTVFAPPPEGGGRTPDGERS
jgi:quercetin dioxygenase-like cupin family protein